jgi:hypothetical protein
MDRAEFDEILAELHLNQTEVARLMQVSARTVRRWMADLESMPGYARELLRAWRRCNRAGLDWADRIGSRRLCETLGLTYVPNPAWQPN